VSAVRIQIETLGLPALAAVIGRQAEIELRGCTVADLVAEILDRFSPDARRFVLDADGGLERSIQIMVNDEGVLSRDELPRRVLADGDRVRFMLLVCGG